MSFNAAWAASGVIRSASRMIATRLPVSTRAFEAVLELDPDNESARGYLSYIATIQHESEAAGQEPAAFEAPKTFASDAQIRAEGFYQNALAAERKGEFYAAIRHDLRALEADPEHRASALLKESVYGLTELHRGQIASALVVGNPGCFAVSCTCGLAPAVQHGLVEPGGIICDCKTGVSGAGKKPAAGFHYPERYDSASAYRLSGHQHTMEIEQELSLLAGGQIRVTLTPQVVPMVRGILSTLYGSLSPGITHAQVLDAYRETYRNEPFIAVKDWTEPVATNDVRGSNRLVITVACDERTGTFRAISHLDNLVKGQAGSALQNLNVMFGLDETLGLDWPGSHP